MLGTTLVLLQGTRQRRGLASVELHSQLEHQAIKEINLPHFLSNSRSVLCVMNKKFEIMIKLLDY